MKKFAISNFYDETIIKKALERIHNQTKYRNMTNEELSASLIEYFEISKQRYHGLFTRQGIDNVLFILELHQARNINPPNGIRMSRGKPLDPDQERQIQELTQYQYMTNKELSDLLIVKRESLAMQPDKLYEANNEVAFLLELHKMRGLEIPNSTCITSQGKSSESDNDNGRSKLTTGKFC
jgi:hypothetical protein